MGHTKNSRERAYAKAKKRRETWFITNGPCTFCGSWEQLELDHVNKHEKESHNVWSWSKDKQEKELAKCRVLCRTCHTHRHQWPMFAKMKHGTATMYNNWGCRCVECKQWKRIENGRRKEMQWRSCYK